MQEQQAYREAFQLPMHATTTVDCNEICRGAYLLPH